MYSRLKTAISLGERGEKSSQMSRVEGIGPRSRKNKNSVVAKKKKKKTVVFKVSEERMKTVADQVF